MGRNLRKSIRLNQSEFAMIQLKLENSNITFSDYAREIIVNGKVKITQSSINQDLLYELNRIGNNLNQISKYVNQEKSLDIQVLQTLVSIEKEIKKLHT
jgi:hypothetical protein